jgi:hypothetical protein
VDEDISTENMDISDIPVKVIKELRKVIGKNT